ncbi:hypothetical protein [Thauera sp.]|uniref:hypothetical protein n=1 Tax=Thauera sp. TaxID=1905334 RepID=UPI0039E23C99
MGSGTSGRNHTPTGAAHIELAASALQPWLSVSIRARIGVIPIEAEIRWQSFAQAAQSGELLPVGIAVFMLPVCTFHIPPLQHILTVH